MKMVKGCENNAIFVALLASLISSNIIANPRTYEELESQLFWSPSSLKNRTNHLGLVHRWEYTLSKRFDSSRARRHYLPYAKYLQNRLNAEKSENEEKGEADDLLVRDGSVLICDDYSVVPRLQSCLTSFRGAGRSILRGQNAYQLTHSCARHRSGQLCVNQLIGECPDIGPGQDASVLLATLNLLCAGDLISDEGETVRAKSTKQTYLGYGRCFGKRGRHTLSCVDEYQRKLPKAPDLQSLTTDALPEHGSEMDLYRLISTRPKRNITRRQDPIMEYALEKCHLLNDMTNCIYIALRDECGEEAASLMTKLAINIVPNTRDTKCLIKNIKLHNLPELDAIQNIIYNASISLKAYVNLILILYVLLTAYIA